VVPRPHRDAHPGVRGDSEVRWFEGNYSDYEADRKRRLGKEADAPHRIKYSAFGAVKQPPNGQRPEKTSVFPDIFAFSLDRVLKTVWKCWISA
jgi:hypothetical protein